MYINSCVFKGFRHLIILQQNLALLGHRTFAIYIVAGCYQGPRDMLLTLSPFAVDSFTPSYRRSQHPPRAPIPHHFSQLLQPNNSYKSRPISRSPPVSPSCTFPRPSPPPLPLSTRQHHLLLQTVHPHHVPEEQDLLLYVDATSLLAVIPISLHWVFTSSLFE